MVHSPFRRSFLNLLIQLDTLCFQLIDFLNLLLLHQFFMVGIIPPLIYLQHMVKLFRKYQKLVISILI